MRHILSALLVLYFSFILAGSAHAAESFPTNRQVLVAVSTNNVPLLGVFGIEYTLPGQDQIIQVDTTNYDFSKTSVSLRLLGTESNRFALGVRSYEISNFNMPGLLVTAIQRGRTNSFYTPSFPVNQQLLTNKIPAPAPIEEIFDMPDYLPRIIAGICLFAAGGITALIIMLIRRRAKTPGSSAAPAHRIDPYQEALEALQSLSMEEFTEANYKEMFVRISEIDRRFLERIWSFPAMEMASSEIYEYLEKQWLVLQNKNRDFTRSEFREILSHVFRLCDRVKYAKHKPDNSQKNTAIQESFSMIEKVRELLKAEETPPDTASREVQP